MKLPSTLRGRPALLVVAHPGHELRVHAWLELARPEVWVLTDGTGSGAANRLPSTHELLERIGARPGSIFGAFSDRHAYELLLTGEVAPLVAIARRLAAWLVERSIAGESPYVVADALEGFNPVHDLCRILVDTAILYAEGKGTSSLALELPLEAAPDSPGRDSDEHDVRLVLDEGALARKIAAARAYPEMAAEVERALATHGESAFGVERLRTVRAWDRGSRPGGVPFYERHGEDRVAAGHYAVVLRHDEHFMPFAERLRQTVLGG